MGDRNLRWVGSGVKAGVRAATAIVAALLSAGVTVAGPAISSIGGVTNTNSGITNGRVDESIGTAYNGKLVVNDETGAYPWTIKGTAFGTTPGSVYLYGRKSPVLSWSDTAIKVDVSGAQVNPSQPWNWAGLSTTLRVQTAAGASVDQGVEIVPAVKTRIFGQCAYWVAFRRHQLGMTPSPTAYGGYTTIGTSWVPKKGDQLQFTFDGGLHSAIIESVTGPTVQSDSTTTYSVTISQLNAAGHNEYSEYTSPFKFRGTSVLSKPKFASWGTEATSYYR